MELVKLKKFINLEDRRLKKRSVGVVDQEKRILARMVKLTEEVGELADAILASQGRQRSDKLARRANSDLSGEFADVVITVFLLAKVAGVNIPNALDEKIKIINQRYRGR